MSTTTASERGSVSSMSFDPFQPLEAASESEKSFGATLKSIQRLAEDAVTTINSGHAKSDSATTKRLESSLTTAMERATAALQQL